MRILPEKQENEGKEVEARHFRECAIAVIELVPSDPVRANENALSLLNEVRPLQNPSGESWVLCALGTTKFGVGNLSEAINHLEQALYLARHLEDRRLEAYCLHRLGACHFNRSEYLLGLEYTYQALAIRRALPNKTELTASIGAIGAIQGTLGNLQEAAAYFSEALEIARGSGDRAGQAITLGNLALLQLKIDEQNPEILTLFAESARLAGETLERRTLVSTLTNWASALVKQGHIADAEIYSRQAVEHAKHISSSRLCINAYLQLGSIYIQQERWNEAVVVLRQAEREAANGGITEGTSRLPMTWGHYRRARKDYKQAYECFLRAREQGRLLGEKEVVAEAELALAETSEANDEPRKALAHFRTYHDLQTLLDKQSAINLLIAQQAKVAVDAAERETELARKEAELARLRSVELVEANRQKDRLLQQLQHQANRLARQAIEDPLTGLYNRRYLTEYLGNELRRSREQASPFTIIIADLDNFKNINDRFTHAVGDDVLKTTAQIMLLACRPGDVVARYGGEEFVIALPDTNAFGAEVLCERIRRSIESYNWQQFHSQLTVTISLGIADEIVEHRDELLAQADRRLYQAKHEGKNRTVSGFTERITDTTPPDSLPFSDGDIGLPHHPFSAL
jgi:diguanylate cyclase (GGDEF)-like protein